MIFRNTAQSPVIEQRSDEPPDITGLGSPFYQPDDPTTEYQLWDGARERVMPTAYDSITRDVWASFNHSPDNVYGRMSAGTLELSKTESGLSYRIRGSSASDYQNLVAKIQRGDVLGSSVSFLPISQKWIEGTNGDPDVRELHQIELHEVGPVTSPAFSATSVGLRCTDDEMLEARQSYDIWRDKVRHEKMSRVKFKNTLDKIRAKNTLALFRT